MAENTRITFGYFTGKTLTFSAYQPDGTARGAEDQSLPEIETTGYYTAISSENLTPGDVVIIESPTRVVGWGQYKPETSSDVRIDPTLVWPVAVAESKTTVNVYDERKP